MEEFKLLKDIIIKTNKINNSLLIDIDDLKDLNDDMESFEEDYQVLNNNIITYKDKIKDKDKDSYAYPAVIRSNILGLEQDYSRLYYILDIMAMRLKG